MQFVVPILLLGRRRGAQGAEGVRAQNTGGTAGELLHRGIQRVDVDAHPAVRNTSAGSTLARSIAGATHGPPNLNFSPPMGEKPRPCATG